MVSRHFNQLWFLDSSTISKEYGADRFTAVMPISIFSTGERKEICTTASGYQGPHAFVSHPHTIFAIERKEKNHRKSSREASSSIVSYKTRNVTLVVLRIQ
mmetsp:Transcript_13593/g.25537  ORF Transcript_13593/g.25537 Transcript_13593/m.25537 type:complete len:101 (+) Transcript_13593:577-879(+)